MEYLWPIIVASFWGPMLRHFKKSNEILETWSPHCKNLAFEDPPSLKFQNRTDITGHAKKSFWTVCKDNPIKVTIIFPIDQWNSLKKTPLLMTISTYLWVITLFLIIYACFVNFLGLNFLILINVPCLSHARVSRLSSAFLHVACELFSICVFHLSNREFGDVSFTATLVGFISSAITYSRTYNTGFCLLIPYHNE